MTATIKPVPVRRTVTVEASVEKAFEVNWTLVARLVFDRRFALKSAVIEPRSGGRWYEVGEDGRECDWGEVLDWHAPSRLLLAWRIRGDWRYDPDLLTEVEVRFIAQVENSTRVELEHRRLENLGDGAQRLAQPSIPNTAGAAFSEATPRRCGTPQLEARTGTAPPLAAVPRSPPAAREWVSPRSRSIRRRSISAELGI